MRWQGLVSELNKKAKTVRALYGAVGLTYLFNTVSVATSDRNIAGGEDAS